MGPVPLNFPLAMPQTPQPIIADRAEFIDALMQLRRGRVLVRPSDCDERCLLDGSLLYTAYKPLADYELIGEYPNPDGFEHARYYRLTPRGREFADQACQAWRQRPLLQRLAVRLMG
jgi:DNA-binding MarR family transcriptional regulator